jgi:gluconate 5-dehydrogenase
MTISEVISLKNKVALVTGASRGLGRGFAKALAEAGADLVITCRHESELSETALEIRQMGREVLSLESDISDEQQVIKMVEETVKRFGKVDILVNNAAKMRVDKSPEATSLEEWKSVLDTNVSGPFMCSKEVAKVMKGQKSGKIINVCSMSGYIVNKYFHGGSYEVSKSALAMMTKALAIEWAPYNINVNAIAPGYYYTEPNELFFKKEPDLYEKITEMIPLKKLGNVEQLSYLVMCLASKIADYMTGSVVIIDGGYTLW